MHSPTISNLLPTTLPKINYTAIVMVVSLVNWRVPSITSTCIGLLQTTEL